MSESLLTTKLYIPSSRSELVHRSRLIDKMNEGLHRKLTLISAPAGFGKTTVVTEWLEKLMGEEKNETQVENRIAWLSLDEKDNDPVRFLTYLITALDKIRGIDTAFANNALEMLKSPQLPRIEIILTNLVNKLAAVSGKIIFILDDYHLCDSQLINDSLRFLLENLPPQLHLVITTREDPLLPLASLRAKNDLNELRAADLRFTSSEAARFLNQIMSLNLSAEDITVLENRTEGWVTGLQLAAISMQGSKDKAGFIESFTGSHRYILDYLVEEVLNQQSESIQDFLYQTAILDWFDGSLCDVLTEQEKSQEILEYLEQANLFLIPLDDERRWYRYHHLFVEFLRQRLQQKAPNKIVEYHIRASKWYEENGFENEAFHHAVQANDIERAERLVEGDGIHMHFRGLGIMVLNWLASLPPHELNARPSLWVIYASTLLFVGQHTGVEQKLQAAEAALQDVPADEATKDLVGRIASLRATLAVIQNDVETIITESLRAQENLHPDNLTYRISTTFTLGTAYKLQGDKKAASKAFAETISIGGKSIYAIAAMISLGQIQETNNQLTLATKSYKTSLDLAGDPPPAITCEGFLGLARIYYEWNDLDAAELYGQQGLQMIQLMENVDSLASYGIILSRLMLARGDVPGAVTVLEEAEEFVHQNNFEFRLPDIAAAKVLALVQSGEIKKAAQLAERNDLPLSQARAYLAEGDSSSALSLLDNYHPQLKELPDEHLRVLVLQAVAYQAHGELDYAIQALTNAMVLAEPNGFIRTFLDEGPAIAELLTIASARRVLSDYASKLLAAFDTEKKKPDFPSTRRLIDPLSKRELEILALIATGLKNKEIAEKLFLSINTIHYHTKNIYNKLGVNNRTLAIFKARELNLLQDE